MQRLKIYFSYDGTQYFGFQRQKHSPKTVQETLESALSRMLNTRVSILASGRTDTGVHARIQVCHGDVPKKSTQRFSTARLELSLNSLLPRDIRILKIEKVPRTFHSIRDSKKKMYVYFVDPSPVQMPWLRQYSWHLRLPLNWAAIEKATAFLKGTHDFAGFKAANSNAKTSTRTIYSAEWGLAPSSGPFSSPNPIRVFRIAGSGFLKHMVRSIVGTLVYVGMGRAQPEIIQKILESGDRKIGGATAPAHGLWLWDIEY